MSVAGCDVLVIGAGLAGHMAALEAARRGRKVIVLSKVRPSETHSALPEGGINVAVQAGDDWRQQAADLWNDGHHLSDWDAVEAACKEAREIVLDEVADLLDTDAGGNLKTHNWAGSKRTVRAERGMGFKFLRRLSGELAERGVSIQTDRIATSLVLDGGACVGVTAFNILSGQVEGYTAPSVVLCSGGFGHVYLHTAHGSRMSGDGQALAYRAGVPLKNMEFVRFHHTLLYGTNYAILEGAYRLGMRLYNKDGERFLAKYDPRMEAAPSLYLKRYMQIEAEAGLAVDGRYFLADFTHLGERRIEEVLSRTRRGCLEAAGLDIVRDRVPVMPGVFVTLGGIETDVDGRTSLSGLYAAGECACAGVLGADWKVGNTLMATMVFGRRAGRAAATGPAPVASERLIEAQVQREAERLGAIASRDEGEGAPYHVLLGELRRVMSEDVGIIRDRSRLQHALEAIGDLKRRYQRAVIWDRDLRLNYQLVGYLELGNMLEMAEAVASAALARTESRGGHWRSDFQEQDDQNWLVHSLQHYTASGPSLSHAPVRVGEFSPLEPVTIL